MADDLIARLSDELEPAPKRAVPRRLATGLAAGAILAAMAMLAWLGLRPDLAEAVFGMMYWWKFLYTAAFAGLAFWATTRLARPGGSMRKPMAALFALIVVAGGMGIAQLLIMPPTMSRGLVMGSTALVCPFYIAALAIPIYAATVLVMRRLAPTNLMGAGLAAGLLAGSAAAWVYAFHCDENGMPFLAIWYTTGILIAALGGAVAGRWALRW
jgi:hypothetical protein